MRVLLVTRHWPFPALRGESVVASGLLHHLCSRHEVHLAVLDPPESEARGPLPEVASVTQVPAVPRSARERWAASLSRLPKGLLAMTSAGTGAELARTIRLLDPDLVQLSSVGLALYGRYLGAERPTVLVANDSMLRTLERLREREPDPIRRLRLAAGLRRARSLERHVYPIFDRVTVVSEADARMIRATAPAADVRVIPLGVDVERFAPAGGNEAPDPPTLGLLGNYRYPPNERAAVALLREVLPAVRRERVDTRALVVGPDPSPEMLELSRRTPGAVVTGLVRDVPTELRRMTVLVACLPTGSGVKTKVLEAMSAGVPVVGNAIALEGIDGDPGEHFLAAETPAAAATAVLSLLADDALRRRLGRRGRELVSRDHSSARQAARYDALWGELAKRP